MKLIGKNTDFVVIWDEYKMYYTVYYKGKQLIEPKYAFIDIHSYLN